MHERGGPTPTTVHLGRARQGDARSLSWLIHRLTPWLRLQARHRVTGGFASSCDPDDLVQDVWLITLPRLHELGERDGRRTPVLLRFLATTLLRRSRDLLERYMTGRALRADLDPASAGASTPAVAATVTGALDALIRDERSRRIAEALGSLAARDRELVVLRGIEGHPYAEISAVLGDAPNTLSVRYRRLLAALRAKLGDDAPGDLERD